MIGRRESGTYIFSHTHHEVKGLFFVVARKYVLDTYGEDAVAGMVDVMSERHRPAMREPLHSSWYVEEALQESLAAFQRVVARGDDHAFLSALEACTVDGVNRFFQLLIGLASPAFVLRKCPVLWRFVRRGPGRSEERRVG